MLFVAFYRYLAGTGDLHTRGKPLPGVRLYGFVASTFGIIGFSVPLITYDFCLGDGFDLKEFSLTIAMRRGGCALPCRGPVPGEAAVTFIVYHYRV